MLGYLKMGDGSTHSWIIRILQGLLSLSFLAWPGVLIAGIMSAAGEDRSPKTAYNLFVITYVRLFMVTTIFYPVVFVAFFGMAWKLFNKESPLAAYAATFGGPFVYILGVILWTILLRFKTS